MPVEASDIGQGAMNTGDFPYTGCEEEGLGSDDDVRKKMEWTRQTELSNQIHIANRAFQRKPWKSGPTFKSCLQTRSNKPSAFSADAASLLWKTREQASSPVYIPDAHRHPPVPD
jgi:hypothetical protein